MRNSKYTYELLAPIVAESKSVSDVIRALGLKLVGGNFRYIGDKISTLGIDSSHFQQTWNKGLRKETCKRVEDLAKAQREPDDVVLIANRHVSSRMLRERLIKYKPYVCSICGIFEWLGKDITLHVDHENGDRRDNRLENLRFLCPNCHQQTDTWGNKARVVELVDTLH